MAEYIKKTDAMSDVMCTGIACRECSFDSVDGCKISKFFSELPTIDIPDTGIEFETPREQLAFICGAILEKQKRNGERRTE